MVQLPASAGGGVLAATFDAEGLAAWLLPAAGSLEKLGADSQVGQLCCVQCPVDMCSLPALAYRMPPLLLCNDTQQQPRRPHYGTLTLLPPPQTPRSAASGAPAGWVSGTQGHLFHVPLALRPLDRHRCVLVLQGGARQLCGTPCLCWHAEGGGLPLRLDGQSCTLDAAARGCRRAGRAARWLPAAGGEGGLLCIYSLDPSAPPR